MVNVVGYRVLALDFDLWSRTKKEIQQLYLEHFITLLRTSRYKTFNAKQRLSKMNIVRKLLFAVQADWYHGDMLQGVIDVLAVVAEMIFSKEETIKPIVSYLAANLPEGASAVRTRKARPSLAYTVKLGTVSGAASPHSAVSRFEVRNPQEKAEHVFIVLVDLLSNQNLYTKFIAALPITRICILLLGDHPTSLVAAQVLRLVNVCLRFTSSFSRKFELISGWSVMKTVLPTSWSLEVNQAAFDVLLGRFDATADFEQYDAVVCPGIIPSILGALQHGMSVVSGRSCLSDGDAGESDQSLLRLRCDIDSAKQLNDTSPGTRKPQLR